MERARLPTGLSVRHPAGLLATWFGAGLLPMSPGTWGSLAALPFAWALATAFGGWGLAVAAVLLFLLGWWAASVVVARGGGSDPQAIVVDEVAGQWLTLAAVPPAVPIYVLGFALFRLADIVKPWPARWAERRFPGALGVMLDDALAAAYAGSGLYLVWASMG